MYYKIVIKQQNVSLYDHHQNINMSEYISIDSINNLDIKVAM